MGYKVTRGSIAILHLHPAEFFMKIERGFGRMTGFAVISVKQIFYFFKFLLCKIFKIFEFDAQGKPLMGFERNIDKRFKYIFFKYNRNFYSHFISPSICKYSTKEEGCQGVGKGWNHKLYIWTYKSGSLQNRF